ncbi:MAG: hypothetical protein JWL97_1294 [Gemmatimonadales bacterium]|nr:hypothetical protein [Gemmatimonadales bacterium]
MYLIELSSADFSRVHSQTHGRINRTFCVLNCISVRHDGSLMVFDLPDNRTTIAKCRATRYTRGTGPKLTPLTRNHSLRYGSFEESSPIGRKGASSILVSASKNRTAGSLASLEVCDKGKPGESRRRKATRLKRVLMRHASRAAESHSRGGRVMRAFILAVTGLAIGVTACGSYGTSVEIQQPAHVASVSVALPSSSVLAGQTLRATATPMDAHGHALTDRPINWYSSSAAVAAVSDVGVISAVAPGTATVSAVSEGVSGEAAVTVLAPAPIPVATVSVSPGTSNLPVGTTVQLSATTYDANNTVLTGRSVGWSSANAGIASVTSNGLVSAVSVGTTQITASSEGKSTTATITATAPAPVPVATISVSPATSSLLVGATVQLSATTYDANNNVLTGRSVGWSSANAGIASVNSNGLVSAVSAGTTQITASSEGKSTTATITVTPPAPVPVATVSISPASSSVLVGATVQLSATTRDANNNVLTGRVVTWSSPNAGIATVTSNGLVSAVSVGTIQITASSEGMSTTATITVTAPVVVPVATVSVAPASSSLPVGSTVQLSATTRDANNNVLTGRVVTWSSANAGIASVNSSGLVTIVAQGGPITITATSEMKTGTAAITGTPSTATGWRGHEPSGMTTISDQPFNSLPSNGWTGWFNYDLASDGTGPQSPGSAFENIYPAGWSGGGNPGLAEIGFNAYRTLYASMYVKHSSNFQGHTSGVNKIIHIWVGGLNHLFLNAAGNGSGPLVAQIRLQGIAGGGNFDAGTAGIYDNGVELARGQWHLIEVVAVSNTGSNLDGSVSLYVDGLLAASCSGIRFEAGAPLFNTAKLDPTWGGIGGTVSSQMSIRVDHIYMSGKN